MKKTFVLEKATRYWLKERGIRMADLERMTGISRMTLVGNNSSSDTGRVSTVRMTTCERIADALGIEITTFIRSGLVEKE